jgi:hypothetical protein
MTPLPPQRISLAKKPESIKPSLSLWITATEPHAV